MFEYDLCLKTSAGATVWTRYAEGSVSNIVSVNDASGVDPTGVSVSTAGINAALASLTAGQVIIFPGNYLIDGTLTIPVDNVTLMIFGTITAKASMNFEYMLYGTGRTGVTVIGGLFNANQAARASVQNIRFMGAGFTACTDCGFVGVRVTGTRGYSGTSAVGLGFGGPNTRCFIDRCHAYDCGVSGGGTDSDAYYTKGTQNVISNSTAYNCTDTGFVIEDSNYSVISGCTSVNCLCGGGITVAGASDCYGNVINGLTVTGWYGNSGGVLVGTLASTGNLYNSTVAGVSIRQDVGASGTGPGLGLLSLGSGKIRGLTAIAPRIDGSTGQGIVVSGDDIEIVAPNVKNVGRMLAGSAIQINSGTTGCVINGGRTQGGMYGVIIGGSSDVTVDGLKIENTTYQGMYAGGTSTINVLSCYMTGVTGGRYAKDGGATVTGDAVQSYTASAYDGANITHGFANVTPSSVIVTPTVAGDIAEVTAIDSVHFTVALKKWSGGILTAGSTQTIYWQAKL